MGVDLLVNCNLELVGHSFTSCCSQLSDFFSMGILPTDQLKKYTDRKTETNKLLQIFLQSSLLDSAKTCKELQKQILYYRKYHFLLFVFPFNMDRFSWYSVLSLNYNGAKRPSLYKKLLPTLTLHIFGYSNDFSAISFFSQLLLILRFGLVVLKL